MAAIIARFNPGNAARASTCKSGDTRPAILNIWGTRKMLYGLFGLISRTFIYADFSLGKAWMMAHPRGFVRRMDSATENVHECGLQLSAKKLCKGVVIENGGPIEFLEFRMK